eukprot:5482678-Pyramimonas_sp.AAC.1
MSTAAAAQAVRPREEDGRPLPNDGLFFFANISEWGPRSERFMRAQAEQYDVLGFAETHLRGEKLEKMKVDMSKD